MFHTDIRIGDVLVSSIVERDGPWRKPELMFPTCDPALARHHLLLMDPILYDAASGQLIITYQTFVVRTRHHLVLVDTCLGEDKGYASPMNFPTAPWLAGFQRLGLAFSDVDYVFCTHLHIDHTGWNTRRSGGRWAPTLNACRS